MIRNQRLILVGLVVVLLAAYTALAVDSYEVPWWTVNGGGDTSEGNTYAVSGTLGQPDAGLLEGGGYSLGGGYRVSDGWEPLGPVGCRKGWPICVTGRIT